MDLSLVLLYSVYFTPKLVFKNSIRSRRTHDKKLEKDKLDAELNLLYLEKKQAEQELGTSSKNIWAHI